MRFTTRPELQGTGCLKTLGVGKSPPVGNGERRKDVAGDGGWTKTDGADEETGPGVGGVMPRWCMPETIRGGDLYFLWRDSCNCTPPFLVRQRMTRTQGFQETPARNAKNSILEKLFLSTIQEHRPGFRIIRGKRLERLQVTPRNFRGILDLDGDKILLPIDDKINFRPGPRPPEVQ